MNTGEIFTFYIHQLTIFHHMPRFVAFARMTIILQQKLADAAELIPFS